MLSAHGERSTIITCCVRRARQHIPSIRESRITALHRAEMTFEPSHPVFS
jgi:hypothetical protein